MEEAGYRTELRDTLNKVTDLNERLIERLAQLSLYINRAGLEVPSPDAGRLAPIVALKEPEQFFPQKRLRTGENSSSRHSSQFSLHASVLEGRIPAQTRFASRPSDVSQSSAKLLSNQEPHGTEPSHGFASQPAGSGINEHDSSQRFTKIQPKFFRASFQRTDASNALPPTPSMVPLDLPADVAEFSDYEGYDRLINSYESQPLVKEFHDHSPRPAVATDSVVAVEEQPRSLVQESFTELTHSQQQSLQHNERIRTVYEPEATTKLEEHIVEAYQEKAPHREHSEPNQIQGTSPQENYNQEYTKKKQHFDVQDEQQNEESQLDLGNESVDEESLEYIETSVVRYPPADGQTTKPGSYHNEADEPHKLIKQEYQGQQSSPEMSHSGSSTDRENQIPELSQSNAHLSENSNTPDHYKHSQTLNNRVQSPKEAGSPEVVDSVQENPHNSGNVNSQFYDEGIHAHGVSVGNNEASSSNDIIMLDSRDDDEADKCDGGDLDDDTHDNMNHQVTSNGLDNMPSPTNLDARQSQLAIASQKVSQNLSQNNRQRKEDSERSHDRSIQLADAPSQSSLAGSPQLQSGYQINQSSDTSRGDTSRAQTNFLEKDRSLPVGKLSESSFTKLLPTKNSIRDNVIAPQLSAATRLLQAPTRGLADFAGGPPDSPHNRHSAPTVRPSAIARNTSAFADHSFSTELDKGRKSITQNSARTSSEPNQSDESSNCSSRSGDLTFRQTKYRSSPINQVQNTSASMRPVAENAAATTQLGSHSTHQISNRLTANPTNKSMNSSYSRLGSMILNNERLIAEKSGRNESNQAPSLGKLAPPAVIMRSLNRIPSPNTSTRLPNRSKTDVSASTLKPGSRTSHMSALGENSTNKHSNVAQSNLPKSEPKLYFPGSAIQLAKNSETDNYQMSASKAMQAPANDSMTHEEPGVENILNSELLENSISNILPSQSTPARDNAYSLRLSPRHSSRYPESQSNSTPARATNYSTSRENSRLSLQNDRGIEQKSSAMSHTNSDMFVSALSSIGSNDSVRGQQSHQLGSHKPNQNPLIDESSISHSTKAPSTSYQVQNMPGAWPRPIPREANIQAPRLSNPSKDNKTSTKRVRPAKRMGHIVEHIDDSLPDLSRVSENKNLNAGNGQR